VALTGPLAGVKLIELGGIGPGPHAAMVLADLGADMLLDCLRPGTCERVGIGPDERAAVNLRLNYARITRLGTDAPLAARRRGSPAPGPVGPPPAKTTPLAEIGWLSPNFATLVVVAVRASREIVIDAPPDVILDALADVEAFSSWSPVHKRMEVLDRYPNGRPHHVKATVGILGIVDKEILEYRWGPDWVVWDAEKTFQQHGQHVEYTLKREGVDKTRVRFDITVEPTGPIPDFIVKRASEIVFDAATERLRNQVMGAVG
jgi:uncharacterized protein YndB with AHSA1/START domain